MCNHKHWVGSLRQMGDNKTNFVMMVVEVILCPTPSTTNLVHLQASENLHGSCQEPPSLDPP